MSPCPPADRIDHVVVVSNLGQARNAVAWARTRSPEEAVLVIVIGGAPSSRLVERLVRFVRDRGLRVRTLELPQHATDPRPLVLRRTVRRYQSLVDEVGAATLWIANTNVHYGVLASIFAAEGSRICYFEEGVGTYRRASDPALAAGGAVETSLRRAVAIDARRYFGIGTGVSAVDVARRVRWNGRKFTSGVVGHVVRRLARHRTYRRLLVRLSPDHAGAFFAPRRVFDEAWVAFPDALDRDVIDAAEVRRLDVRPDAADVEQATALLHEVLGEVLDADRPALFVSQPYLDRGVLYYGAVAAAIRAAGLVGIFLQPHPRERDYNVDILVRALEHEGIEVERDERSRDLTAEALLATGRFATCVAVSSSTLIYGPLTSPSCSYRWIGPDVASALQGSADAEGLRRLEVDLDIVRGLLDTTP